jgi:pimeloyl-ACP methyl ester carboxylesterase
VPGVPAGVAAAESGPATTPRPLIRANGCVPGLVRPTLHLPVAIMSRRLLDSASLPCLASCPAQAQVIPRAGHWLMEEQPAPVIAALRLFLTR